MRNLVRYLLSRKSKSNERVLRHESLLALPMLPGETPLGYAKQWASELWSFSAQERVGKKPPEDYFVHSVMSFFPGNAVHEADQLTAEQAVELAKEAMAEVAPGERQVLYVVHGDKAHLHVHIVFSTVELGGRIWNPRMDFRLWEAAAARLEVKHGLYQVTVGRAGGEPARRKSPSSNELNMVLRTGQSSDRMLLQQALDAALGSVRKVLS
ncbi:MULTISPECIES: relaxase/mobilization nuclease domain-containing protein [Pseudomonas]|uniref:relaxase/mobilization nuclease domain-containing protein n=1 Tax=Pseudomonas guariconensis TaxID=1288410 RepID=UPI002097BBA0|nr:MULTISPECIES: relaxase/mobilization nuclease domain-containing protein [Pseudomonas]MCO7597250.1 relaxase/mobilization nuclease domain-containing protein [Pseudomonas guariconensis]MCU7222160.1 relaxase/mobilization nuclease domain-containing protein [Pseudomonas brassicacearum]